MKTLFGIGFIILGIVTLFRYPYGEVVGFPELMGVLIGFGIIILPGISAENLLTNPEVLSLIKSYFGFSLEVITELIMLSITGSIPSSALENLSIPEQFKNISYLFICADDSVF